MSKVPHFRPRANKLPRTSFDLSGHEAFTISPGMLLPCFVKELNPHDHIEISPQSFIRLQPLQTSAFVRLKQNIEYYFVPMSSLYTFWNSFITGLTTKDTVKSSTFFSNPFNSDYNLFPDGVLSLPSLNSKNLWQYLFYNSSKNDKFVASTNEFGFKWCNDAARLMDQLGYGYGWFDGASGNSPSHFMPDVINPLRLAAYQSIYYNFYRNADYEDKNPSACNLDWLIGLGGDGSSFATDANSANAIRPLFTLRYRNWKKDFATNVIPTLLYDKVRQTVNNFVGAQPMYTDEAVNPGDQNLENTIAFYNPSIDYTSTTFNEEMLVNMFSNLNTASVRNAFALEKLLETTRLAGKNYDAQIKAHYGFDSPNDKMEDIQYLGGVDSPILINEVVASATTASGNNTLSSLGEIAGKGTSMADGKKISFDAPTFGIVMGIMSIIPEADYSASTIDRFNQKIHREDYFQPEFDRLGYQPLYLREVYGKKSSQNGSDQFGGIAIGWQPRYNEYKTGKDLIHFGFESNSLSSWCSVREVPDFLSEHMTQFLKINPACLDSIFAVNYGGGVSTDKFLVNTVHNCFCVRDMSETGQFSL